MGLFVLVEDAVLLLNELSHHSSEFMHLLLLKVFLLVVAVGLVVGILLFLLLLASLLLQLLYLLEELNEL